MSVSTETDQRPLKVLAVGDDQSRRQQLVAALRECPGFNLAVREAGLSAADCEPGDSGDAIMVAFGDDRQSAVKLLEARRREPLRPVLIAVVDRRESELIRCALRAGADEVIFMPLEPAELMRALLKIGQARQRGAEEEALGSVCSLVSLSGGVGVTTIAALLALALRQKDKSVAVVDLDLQSAGLGAILGMEPVVSLLDTIESDDPGNPDLTRALSTHCSGVALLAPPRSIEEALQIEPENVLDAVEQLRRMFDYVVVDHGSSIDALSVALWAQSKDLFYVVDQSLSAVGRASSFLGLKQRICMEGPSPQLILNRFRKHARISDKVLIETLARPIHAKIPYDPELELVGASGEDISRLSESSLIAKGIDALAAEMCGAIPRFMERPDNQITAFVRSLVGSPAHVAA